MKRIRWPWPWIRCHRSGRHVYQLAYVFRSLDRPNSYRCVMCGCIMPPARTTAR